MKKTAASFIFIFLTGLFTGLFFSISLDEDNSVYLSQLFISSITDTSSGFMRTLISSVISAMSMAALMLASVVSRLLAFLPPAVLWYRGFALGFCSGLAYIGDAGSALSISLIKLLPPSLFFIPAFIMLATACFRYSRNRLASSKRSSREKKDLQTIVFICLGAITAGCVTEALCHLAAL